GEASLSDFYDWFVPATWDIHLWATPQLQETVRKIEYLVDEYSYTGQKELDLKAKLRPLVTSVNIGYAEPAVVMSVKQVKSASMAKKRKARHVSPRRSRSGKAAAPKVRKLSLSAVIQATVGLSSSQSALTRRFSVVS